METVRSFIISITQFCIFGYKIFYVIHVSLSISVKLQSGWYRENIVAYIKSNFFFFLWSF